MTILQVESVFFVKYNRSAFRAVYGRYPSDGRYSKDFLQIRNEVYQAVARAFEHSPQEGQIDIQYKWPNGSQPGTWRTGDRGHLAWFMQQRPVPWSVGDPTANPAISIAGTPNLPSAEQAEAEYDRIVATGTNPWFIAVKLRGEHRVLHLRVYFENPPAGAEDRGFDALPLQVRNAIQALPPDESGFIEFPADGGHQQAPSQVRARELVKRIQKILEREPNVLLVGPPGTGKTVALEDLRALYSTTGDIILFDTEEWGRAWSTSVESRNIGLVFHPSYTYENFVAGLVPSSGQNSIELRAQPGPLLALSHWTSGGNRKALLVLDEFNRGPAAAIFGDTLGLLDKEKRSTPEQAGATIQRPYPEYAMQVPEAYAAADGRRELTQEMSLPAQLAIVAAMNSTDRSVAPLDAALRRRFTVIRVGPDYEVLAHKLELANQDFATAALPPGTNLAQWSRNDAAVLAIKLLHTLNQRIEYCLGEDFALGHALLWNVGGETPEHIIETLTDAILTKVVPTLQMTFLDQDDVLAAVLAVPSSRVVLIGQPTPEDVFAYWKSAPASLAAINPRRLAFTQLHTANTVNQLSALVSLING